MIKWLLLFLFSFVVVLAQDYSTCSVIIGEYSCPDGSIAEVSDNENGKIKVLLNYTALNFKTEQNFECRDGVLHLDAEGLERLSSDFNHLSSSEKDKLLKNPGSYELINTKLVFKGYDPDKKKVISYSCFKK